MCWGAANVDEYNPTKTVEMGSNHINTFYVVLKVDLSRYNNWAQEW